MNVLVRVLDMQLSPGPGPCDSSIGGVTENAGPENARPGK